MMGWLGARTPRKRARIMGFGSVMTPPTPYWQLPARTLRTLENRIARLMNPSLLEKVRGAFESEPQYDPRALALEEIQRFAATRCGAKTRRGTPCQRKALQNRRCRNHGGMSTGPKTLEGRLRALANLKQFREG